MQIPIEDNFEDVLMKAATGRSIGKLELAQKAGLSVDAVNGLLAGRADEALLRKVAPALQLAPEALVQLARNSWQPESIQLDGLKIYNTPFPSGYEGMSVNSFLLWDHASRRAAIFDTGANAKQMLADIAAMDLKVEHLFLTHTHRDHIAAYSEIVQTLGPVDTFASEREQYPGAHIIRHGETIDLGSLKIEARLTSGHSRGGMTFVIYGLDHTAAIVGDALFSLSMGGAHRAFELALKNIREQILSLHASTVICPGHGPMTTVADELQRNPFFCQK
ncbi:MAG: MBL fold metallo-hydrolase [Verrucomicrobiota bacterium]